ncbi:uncharacterized protein RAG0_05622 [Rhynchosporium agropyri]|uniref:Uncharacterized protein n=1 Tax=Rhynchosporium agropyri TaxID=914238 RepID=A0A1E1KDU1_9HELO|nr:uncharacterized protein RAG0_05622 [Rhynchosporium agropyri]
MRPLLPPRIVLSIILIAISASLLGLIGSSLSWKARHKHESATLTSGNGTESANLLIFPRYTQIGSYAILVAAGCGGLVDQLLYLLFTLVKRDIFGLRIPNLMIAKALISLRVCIGIGALVFSFVQYYDSGEFRMSMAPLEGVYEAGHFTMEAWTCQTRMRIDRGYRGDFERLCREGKTARWLLIPYVVLSILLLGLEFWAGGSEVTVQRSEIEAEGSRVVENKV